MCWIGKYNLKQAKQDISIFKIVILHDNKLISAYQQYPYELNKLISSEIQIDSWFNKNDCSIKKALHSYNPKLVVSKTGGEDFEISFKSLLLIDYYTGDCFVRVDGIIPKDSTYCMNAIGECISDKIILKNIIY